MSNLVADLEAELAAEDLEGLLVADVVVFGRAVVPGGKDAEAGGVLAASLLGRDERRHPLAGDRVRYQGTGAVGETVGDGTVGVDLDTGVGDRLAVLVECPTDCDCGGHEPCLARHRGKRVGVRTASATNHS